MSIEWNYNYFTEKFKHMPKHLKIVCIGTTQAFFAIDFSDCSVPAFNMSLWLNYFTYSKRLLEKYSNRIEPHATILITLQYPIFLCSEKCSFTRDNALQYSKILFGKDPHVSVLRQCLYRIIPDSCFSTNNFDSIRQVELRNKKMNHLKIWELEQYVENTKNAWEKEIECDNLRENSGVITQFHKDRLKTSIDHVIEIIDLCRKNDWNPILVSLPFSKIFNDRIPEEFKQNCYFQCIEELIKRTNCKWLDYMQDKRMDDINNYMDVWWLNERGRKKFTKIVLNEIERI